MKMPPSAAEFTILAKRLGYLVFEGGGNRPYNLNIVGWRNKDTRPNYFDDYLAVYWRTGTHWKNYFWKITTYPGVPWLRNPINPHGAAILVPGQYEHVYTLGEFKGREALRQTGKVKVYRDNNLDDRFGMNIEEGFFGIHIHRGSLWANLVGTTSAGCQVFQSGRDFDEFIGICNRAVPYWGKRFTYTLMEL